MSMIVARTIAECRQHRARLDGPVALVPTMGALHAGHVSLIDAAKKRAAQVVASIFVNPTQFGPREDFNKYPRPIEDDLRKCDEAGAAVVFNPSVEEMYPAPLECHVDVGRLADHLCGRFRPGHFKGVATVVLKLFQIVQADRAYFGEKDAQQLAIVRRMVTDFSIPIVIVGVATVREGDGLALSSRNQRLNAEERQLAPALYRALQRVKSDVASGVDDPETLKRSAAREIPNDNRLKLEYLEIVDPRDFQPVARVTGPIVAAGALWVGSTRLIDNVACAPGTRRVFRPAEALSG